MEDNSVSFGLWLKERRRLLDLTQTDLANRVGCSVMTIRKIEADERRPSRQIAELLAGCLEIAPEDRPTFIKVARAELRVERLPQNVRTLNASFLADKRAPVASSPSIGLPRPASSLPIPPTPLVGREHELAAIQRLLQEPHCRLLSLVGPGGIGKTRLAIAAAAAALEGFTAGVYFVPLAPLSGSEFIVPTIADAIGFTFYDATEPQLQLFNYLQEKRLLLVLDNLEHLLDGVDLLDELLQQAPALKLLTTSRERLNLQGEWVFEVQGLPVPAGDTTSAERLEENGAVRLFLQSAQRAQVGFEAPPEEWPAVARICRLMAGLPLGIELAAAWVRLLSCREIAQEIERNIDFLTTSTRKASARHHSIRAVFDHSWKLLSAEEQRVLRQLSVFRGGFRREAAAQVTGASLPTLAGLVDKSLVIAPSPLNPPSPGAGRDPSQGGGREGGRYHLHELLRQFSADKLEAAPEERAATRTRHSDYFLAFLQERGASLTGKGHKTGLDEIEAEVENVRSGWNWAVSQGQVEAIDRALDSLYLFYWRRSHYQEGEETFRRTVEHLQQMPELRWASPADAASPLIPPSTDPLTNSEGSSERDPLEGEGCPAEETLPGKLYMKALARRGAFCIALGRYGLARELLQKSLELARRWADQAEIVICLNFLAGIPLELEEDYLAAERLYQESLALSRSTDDRPGMAETLERLGRLHIIGGDFLNGRGYLEQSLDLLRQMGNQAGMASVLDALGMTAIHLGDFSASEQYYGESLALFKGFGDRLGMALAVGGLGLVAWGRGGSTSPLQGGNEGVTLNEAKQRFEESLALCREIGHQSHTQIRLALLGHVSNSMGRYEEAHNYFQEALNLTQQLGKKAEVSWILSGLGETALGRGDFEAARRYLLEALETHRLLIVVEALVNWALLLKKEAEGSPLPPAERTPVEQTHLRGGAEASIPEQKQQAVEILSLALNQTAIAHRYKEKAARLLAELEAELPPEVASAARERGLAQTVAEMVAKIVGQTK